MATTFLWLCAGRLPEGLEFPIAKPLDYEVQWPHLEESLNPFAVMVMAHLKTKATTGEPQQQKQWKWVLVRRLFEQGYSRDDVVELFRLVDWMMGLPKALEQEFRAELRQYQEERQMPYITSVERLAKEEGVQEGIDLGRRQVIENLLKVRFGVLDEALTAIVEPLLNLPAEAYTRLLLESSREGLIAHFSAGNS